ncbi:MAG TPA: hypothetical protein VKT30_06980 [Caulobacteraceae bacterium]|nr:hypothetical protein [Caulobacteraceae bacterium]
MAPPLAIILLNYRRPQNIGRIVGAARAACPAAPILLLDQAETASLRHRDDIAWSEVWYRRALENKGAGARVPLAAQMPFDRYLAIDDDIFLSAEQLAALAKALDDEPDRMHGVAGQRLEYADGELSLRAPINYVDAQVSLINQAYAFSRAQADAALGLARRLGWERWSDIGPVDDMLLSCAAAKPALCHNLGPFERCASSDDPAVAVWRREGFQQQRLEAARRLVALQAIPVFTPLVVR